MSKKNVGTDNLCSGTLGNIKEEEADILTRLEQKKVTRRDFVKFCSGLAATMGLPLGMAPKIAQALTSPKRPPVIWLSFQQCTGCVETLLRSTHPTLENLILDIISLDYCETLNAAAGNQAEEAKMASIKANYGKYVLVIDGSVPFKDNGIYCKIAGKTAIEHLKEVSAGAAAVIAMGSCSSWGGVPSSPPNPTDAQGLPEAFKRLGIDKPLITIPGCPPNPYNFLSTVVHYLTFKKLPELDAKLRPKFAYGRIIHENCERRPHFDAGRFALEFGDEGHRKGYCLYKLGCKGPETFANCPAILFGDTGAGTWPVGVGHPCFGCTEQGIGFNKPLHTQATIKFVTPPAGYPRIDENRGSGLGAAAAGILGLVAGAAIGAGAAMANNLGASEESSEPASKKKSGKKEE